MTKDDPHTTSLRCYEDLQRYNVDEENEPDHHIEKRYAGNVNVKKRCGKKRWTSNTLFMRNRILNHVMLA